MPSVIVPATEPAVARPAPLQGGPAGGGGGVGSPGQGGGGEPRASRAVPPRVPLAPETLHPALWRGHQLGRSAEQALPSGFTALDAQLPGGGWPRRALSELLLPHLGLGELRLLAPVLAEVQRAGRLVMLFDPPARLSGWALSQLGLDVEQLLLIQAAPQVPVDPGSAVPGPTRPVGGQARLWALEQALKSGHVGAVVAWLPPRLAPDRLRRLQLAAHAHDGPAFVLREWAAQTQASASPLRLGLRAAGIDQLAVRVLKRRGPPALHPVHLRLPAMVPAAVLDSLDLAMPPTPPGGLAPTLNAGRPADRPAGRTAGTPAVTTEETTAVRTEGIPQGMTEGMREGLTDKDKHKDKVTHGMTEGSGPGRPARTGAASATAGTFAAEAAAASAEPGGPSPLSAGRGVEAAGERPAAPRLPTATFINLA